MHSPASVEALRHLLYAMADIHAISETADKLLRDAEYSGCVMPHSLAAISMIAKTATEEAVAILEADIKNTSGDNQNG